MFHMDKEKTIEGVVIVPLKTIKDERGKIMHMMRSDENHFEEFGEIYFSWVNPQVVKGWHLHKKMSLNYAVPVGSIKLVLYDAREGSSTKGQIQEIVMGEDDYKLVRVPPMVWNAFQGTGEYPSMVANCATLPHDPDEIIRKDPHTNEIPYQW